MIRHFTLALVAGAFVAAPVQAQDHTAHAAPQTGGSMMCMVQGGEHAAGMQHGAGAQHAAAGAQQQRAGMMHGQMGGAMQQGGGMHEMPGGYIARFGMLLHHTEELALTAAQTSRIQELVKTAQQDCEQHMKLAHEAHAAANQAMQVQAPDVAAFETQLRAAAQHMVQAHVAVARRGVEALNLLTAEQRTKLQATMKKHEGGGAGH